MVGADVTLKKRTTLADPFELYMYQPVTFPGLFFINVLLLPAADISRDTLAPPVDISTNEPVTTTFEASTTGAELAAVACPFGLFGLYDICFYFKLYSNLYHYLQLLMQYIVLVVL